MRVFVTGMAGFLGSHVAERFRDLGHEVFGIDNIAGGYLDNVPAGVEFHQHDCIDSSLLRVNHEGSDIVYHCAATAYDGLSVFSPRSSSATPSATVEVAIAAVAGKVGRFVMCSSMARYGDLPGPFTEDKTPSPVSPYGIGK